MVIDGRTSEQHDLFAARFDGERILLPARLAREAGFTERDAVDCWLLVVTPGRYRLVKKSTAAATGDLARILDQIDEVGTTGDLLDQTESNARAAIRTRLIHCSVSPRGPGWRINFPKAAKELVPQNEDRTFVFVLTVAGYVELWFPDTLRKATSVPLSRVLP
jgi:hypothetical protein